jgi:hypothetical protein
MCFRVITGIDDYSILVGGSADSLLTRVFFQQNRHIATAFSPRLGPLLPAALVKRKLFESASGGVAALLT